MKTGKVILVVCVVALIGVVLLGLAGGGFLYYMAQDPAGLAAYVESPDKVAKDEQFDLRVIVVNERKKKSLKLESIDLAESYISGFTVRGVEPAAKSSQRVPLDGGQSFVFDKSLAPGSTNVFTFHLRGARTGVHRGDVDVCEGMRFLTVMAQTEVR